MDNGIIKIENEMPVLDKSVNDELIYVQTQIDILQDMMKNYKELIKEEMEAKGIKKIVDETGKKVVTITYIEPTTRETIDTKALKKNRLEIYNDFCRISDVSSSIKISIK